MERVFDEDFVEKTEEQGPSGSIRDLSDEERAEITSGYEDVAPVKRERPVETLETLKKRVMDAVAKRYELQTKRAPTEQELQDYETIYYHLDEAGLKKVADQLEGEVERLKFKLDTQNRRN